MDSSSQSSTSKVTVTYWDPAALYQLIADDLQARLPLRNLHWKSPTRPLRSIDSLHVELLPYSPPPTSLVSPGAPPTASELTRVRSTESSRSAESALPRSASKSRGKTTGGRKERRHQIPGLRNTPYLKVYILRCDDNESYKNTQRKLLREWISTHATSAGGDNHDAFEWLILHVVLPGTPAAQQPRSSSSASNTTGGARWMKTGSTTLLDKIRSDFNSSNSKVDRIVQVRIDPSHPALSTLSPPVVVTPATTPEPQQENEVAWLDLIAKFKSQILASFDARVGQYEDDVRERDSQRILPGWNFCTFFVLKEGLARAFESVGLVEDALVLYDELEFGLEAIIREQAKGEVIGGSFISWTKEGLYWIEEARRKLVARKKGEVSEIDEIDEGGPIGAEKKHYRDLILSNEISVFDFRCYLFARQTTLLIRLARKLAGQPPPAPSGGQRSQETPGNPGAGVVEDDLSRLAELCRRGVEFVTTVSRVLRLDLAAGHQGSSEHPEDEDPDSHLSKEELSAIIHSLVASWTYAVCSQLLSQTASASLPKGLDDDSNKGLLPKRTTSLPAESAAFSQALKGNVYGMEELAAGRAELMILSRSVLESLAKNRGWEDPVGWFGRYSGGDATMEEISLDGDDDGRPGAQNAWVPEGLRCSALRDTFVCDGPDGFYRLFGELSERAMKYYGVAKRYKSAERVESDLAALRFHLKDYQQAVVHLQRMTNFYAEEGWGMVETTLLRMYARCLKETKKTKEYINVLLKLLIKSTAPEKSLLKRSSSFVPRLTRESQASVRGYVSEALALSQELPKSIYSPSSHFWADVNVDHYPCHLPDRDGFEVFINMRYLLAESLPVDRITLKIVSTSSPSRELLMESKVRTEMKKGMVRASVTTNHIIPGCYIVERMAIYAGKLVFSHEFMAKTEPGSLLGLTQSSATPPPGTKKTKLHFYPSPRGVNVRLEMPKRIHLEKMRTVEIIVNTGENHILNGELRVRSATAGLRLITANLGILSASEHVKLKDQAPGSLILTQCPQNTDIRLNLPYSSENELSELMIRLEVDYNTENGQFQLLHAVGVPVALPLAVNVQDVFRSDCLYSKFQVCTAAAEVPLRVAKVNLFGSKTFSTEIGAGAEGSMTVYAKQPANFTFKIRRKEGTMGQEAMSLVIDYTNLDEEIRHSVSKVFRSELEESGLNEYVHWLLPALFQRFRKQTSAELETAALLDEVDIGRYEDYDWAEVLQAISPASGRRSTVEAWLREFFIKHHLVPLRQPHILSEVTRSITIPVEVPQLQVIHTVELNLLADTNSRSFEAPHSPFMVTVGEPLVAELVIHHSRGWDTNPVSAEPLEFVFEIQNHPDVWLVSGKRRAHFTGLPEGNTEVVPLMLVPVKPGHHVLPNVDIRHFGGAGTDSSGGEVGEEQISLETDYKSNAATVIALPDIYTTTVRIDGQHEQIPGRA